jgi:hypothetical protein
VAQRLHVAQPSDEAKRLDVGWQRRWELDWR